MTNINTHSFRIGGASAAFSAGASDALIRVMGRWSSDCYNRYIRVADNIVSKFQQDISLGHCTRVWESDCQPYLLYTTTLCECFYL